MPAGLRFALLPDYEYVFSIPADCYDYGVTTTPSRPFARRFSTVLLDRDGVLNQKMPEGRYVTRWEEFRILPGVAHGIARLNHAGLRTVVVSNQRGIALGRYTLADVEAIHAAFQRELAAQGAHIDAFFVCPHDRGACHCRKPLPGLFEQARKQFPAIDAATSMMIGDSLVDMEFARNLGIASILIDSPEPNASPNREAARQLAGLCVRSLAEAVDAILAV
jgi:D-glycero-D-manno-heptose 1,7-bisphosphate phosphatase